MLFQEKLIKLRKEKGMTQEDVAFEVGVSRQSVSKWETGDAEPNVSTLKALSKVLGVTVDYLLDEDEISSFPVAERCVGINEANALLTVSRKNSFWLALATLLCILSPVCLILLSGLSEYGAIQMSESMAAGLGMLVLLIFVTFGVTIFIICNSKSSVFAYFEKEHFTTEKGVKSLAEQSMKEYNHTYLRNNILGACLCILSLIPLFIGIMLDESNDLLLIALTCCIFPIAGLGVAFFIRGGVIWASFEKLLRAGNIR